MLVTTGELPSVSGFSMNVTDCCGEIPVRPAWSSRRMSPFEGCAHIAAGANRSEKSNAAHRPFMPLSHTHQWSVRGSPSKYSPTAKRVAIDFLVSQ